MLSKLARLFSPSLFTERGTTGGEVWLLRMLMMSFGFFRRLKKAPTRSPQRMGWNIIRAHMERQNELGAGTASSRKWWIFLAVGIGTFMSALDSSVVNTILPVIRNYFKSEVASVEWAVTIYLLVVSSLLLTFGRLGDLRGHKGMYASGFVIFVAASALCGLDHPRQGIASGILATARSVGMVLGVGLAGAIFTSVTARSGEASLFDAVHLGLLVGAGVAVVGVVVSSVRGNAAPTR